MNEEQFKLLIACIQATANCISRGNMGQDVSCYEAEEARDAEDNLAESLGLPRYNFTDKV